MEAGAVDGASPGLDGDLSVRWGAFRYSGKAFIGAGFAFVAVVAPLPFNLLAAALAVIAGDLSRRELRADPERRGTTVSLLAFLVGALVLIIQLVIPAIIAVMLSAAFRL